MATQTEFQTPAGDALNPGATARSWMMPGGAYINEAGGGTVPVVYSLSFLT